MVTLMVLLLIDGCTTIDCPRALIPLKLTLH
jgi:hypothetical protein